MEELCVQRQDQVVPGVCVPVCGVWSVQTHWVFSAMCCVCVSTCVVWESVGTHV